ncbi:MAG TPA: DciA family protein [Gaiellaceae bacterium]|nr:DciA family protein [Gaiellaceae bacterium]
MDRIGGEVERELARSGARPALPLAAITAVWPAAVGAAVAQQAWPLRVSRDGTLHVATSSATWAFELDRLSADILDALASRLAHDAPKKLRFAVGPIPEPGAPESKPAHASTEPLEPTSEEAAVAASAAAEIEDPELRELAARAARASLAKARSGRRF